MMNRARAGRRLAAAAATGALMGTVLVGGAGAGPGDVVLNPGAFTLTLEGNFFDLAGNVIDLPSSSDPAECSDGINNDVAADGGAPQDTNIDFDGAGVGPADAQCNAGAGGALPAADDNSEIKLGHQPKVPIQLTGSIDADGNITVPAAGVSFPKTYVYSSVGGALDINIRAIGDATGTLDPASGASTLDVPIELQVFQSFFGIDCTTSPINIGLSTDPSAAVNAGPKTVTPVPYSTADGTVTVTGNTFEVPAATVTPGTTTNPAVCESVSDGFGVPSPSGGSAAEFLSVSNVIFQPGGTVENTIEGTVTGPSAEPADGVFVPLFTPTGFGIVATTHTDASGAYSLAGMADGDYKVRYFDPQGRYATTYFDGAPTNLRADVVTVAGASTATADQQLAAKPAGLIAGRVTDDGTGAGLANISVQVFSAADGYVGARRTGAAGYYLLVGLPDGDYTVRFSDPTGPYAPEWNLDRASGFNADVVTVSGGRATVDAGLSPAA